MSQFEKYKKVPVGVNLYVRRDGQIRPRSFRWKDGSMYDIDRVLHVERAASTNVGGVGNRYTVMVEGMQRYLYEEDGLWFMEEVVIESA